MSRIEIINPIDFRGWDELVLQYPDYSFFHSSAWARVLSEAYGYRPLYFAAMEKDNPVAIIPVMEVDSFLTGKRGVSLPFSDFSPPLTRDPDQVKGLMQAVMDYGSKAGWKYVEWRDDGDHFDGVQPSLSYYHHSLDLSLTQQQIFSNLRDSTRRNTKKAAKEGVRANFQNALEAVQEFYRLHGMTRKLHGLPPQPFKFFKKIHEHILRKGKGFVVLASYHGENIAGAIYFHFGKKAMYKYGASDRKYQHLRANNLVMWEALRHYAEKDYEALSLGRTDLDGAGLLQFKSGWGAEQETLNYYKYDCRKGEFANDSAKSNPFHGFFKRLPSPILRMAGYLMYKHAA
jgi:hypothetical protein